MVVLICLRDALGRDDDSLKVVLERFVADGGVWVQGTVHSWRGGPRELQDWLRADARFPDFLRRDTISAPFHNFLKSQMIAIETALHLYLKEMGDVKKTF